jgi:hypothetical protein
MTIRLFNPSDAPAVPVLQVLASPGRLIEVTAGDYREDTTADVYLMLFESGTIPTVGDVPIYPAIKICSYAQHSWGSTDSPFIVADGLWTAISSTPLTYTPMAASQDFSIGARITP